MPKYLLLKHYRGGPECRAHPGCPRRPEPGPTRLPASKFTTTGQCGDTCDHGTDISPRRCDARFLSRTRRFRRRRAPRPAASRSAAAMSVARGRRRPPG